MRNTSKLAVPTAVASALALLIAASAFADSRHQERTGQDRGSRGTVQSDRGVSHQENRSGGQPSGRGFSQQPSRGFQQTNPGFNQQQNRSRPQQWDRSSQATRGFQQGADRGDSRQTDRSRPQQWDRSNQSNRGYAPSRFNNQEQRSQQWDRSGSRFSRGFQADRGSSRTGSWDTTRGRIFHENDRVRTEGRIRSFNRERGGFRIFLDGDRYSYWVPEARFRFGSPRVGLSIRFGGVFRGGFIAVDDCYFPPYDGYYGSTYYAGSYPSSYSAGYLSGVVERIDARYGNATIVDDTSGRLVTVDLRSTGLDDLRPGDHVQLTGSWNRAGLFAALRVDNVESPN